MTDSYCVYRYFTPTDRLLYVGCTSKFNARISSHKRASEWFRFVSYITVEHYRSKIAAVAAEERAIRSEMPKFNSIHNLKNTDRAMSKRSETQLSAYWKAMTAEQRLSVAKNVKCVPQYLYQLCHGLRNASPTMVKKLEAATGIKREAWRPDIYS